MRATLHSLLALSCVFRAAAADWPQWRGPRGDGTTPEPVNATNWVATPPTVKWTTEVGRGYSGVAVRNGRVYTLGNATNHNTVVCLDAASGAQVWRHTYAALARAEGTRRGFPGPRATPLVKDEQVFTLGHDGQLKCLSAAHGTPLWETRLERDTTQRLKEWYGFCGSPVLLKDTLYINHGTKGLLVDASTGELCRPSDGKVSGYAAPRFWHKGREDMQLVLFGWNTVKSVNLANSEVSWEIRWHTRFDVNAADPVVCSEGVFVTSGYGVGCALLDPIDGRTVWRNKAIRAQCNPVVYRDGYIYGFDEYINAGPGYLVCLEAQSGREMWRRKGLMGNLIVAGKHLVILTTKGTLILADATHDGYKPLGQTRVLKGTCWIPPSLANGRVYCRSNKGTVVCCELPAPGPRKSRR